MAPLPAHLAIAPILIPLMAGALMLFFEDRERRLKLGISLISTGALLTVALLLASMRCFQPAVVDWAVSVAAEIAEMARANAR